MSTEADQTAKEARERIVQMRVSSLLGFMLGAIVGWMLVPDGVYDPKKGSPLEIIVVTAGVTFLTIAIVAAINNPKIEHPYWTGIVSFWSYAGFAATILWQAQSIEVGVLISAFGGLLGGFAAFIGGEAIKYFSNSG